MSKLATTALLWNAHRLAPATQAAAALAIVVLLWAVGALTQPRQRPRALAVAR